MKQRAALKRTVRNAWWRIAGRFVRNPPLPRHVTSALFVCQGNICRSPFAAAIAPQVFTRAGLNVQMRSAGLVPSRERTPPSDAAAAARTFGVSLDTHQAQPVSQALVAQHSIVLVMEAAQMRELRRRYPAYRDRIFLLALFERHGDDSEPYLRFNMPDPYRRGPAAFLTSYSRIESALTSLAEALRGRSAPRNR